MGKRALRAIRNSPNEYVLRSGEQSVWITVNDFSVYVHRTDEGIIVDIFPLGREVEGSIAAAYAFDSEVENRDYE